MTLAVPSTSDSRRPSGRLSSPGALLRTPEDHALALHPEGVGQVTFAYRVGQKWRETRVGLADAGYAARQLAGQTDAYISQNRFFGPRRIARLAEADALFADLDYYRTPEWAGHHPLWVLEAALDALDSARMPRPTLAVSTGLGLALVWLHRPVPRAALPRWNACQKRLQQVLRSFGADPRAIDAARVLRLVGTVNSKTETRVEVLVPSGPVWDFERLSREILPLDRDVLRSLAVRRARRRSDRTRPVPPSGFTQATLWEGRLTELQRLLKARWFGRLPPGQRDHWLFAAGIAISWLCAGSAAVLRRELFALAREVGGWTEAEAKSRMSAVLARTAAAARGERITWEGRRYDPRYRLRTETIVAWLGITEAEMRRLGFRHLVTPDLARELDRARQAARRRSQGTPTRAEYLAGHAASREATRPWELAGISRATWYRRRVRQGVSGCMVAEPLDGDGPAGK